MDSINYTIKKINRAWKDHTLWVKIKSFLVIMVIRPLVIIPNYLKLDRVERQRNVKIGFTDHRKNKEHHISDQDHIHRIIAAYKKSKNMQKKVISPFQIKGFWAEWISIYFQDLIYALESENLVILSSLFENLHREIFTIGMGGYEHIKNYNTILGNVYMKYVWNDYYNKLKLIDCNPNKIKSPLIGNPTGILHNGNIVSVDALRNAYHAHEMCQLLMNIPKAKIVEIGGGCGGQAYQMIKMDNNISKYIIYDIPEVIAISSYFLLSALPNKNILLYGEKNELKNINDQYDLILFPHFEIEKLNDLSVDFFFNSCSFSEMDGCTAKKYLKVIERSCRKYFYHSNHDQVYNYRNPDGTISTNIIGSELLPDRNLFKRIYKKPRVHGLPEDKKILHFEYLYERLKT